MTERVGARAQEYLAQWVAKVASAEKDYRAAVDQMERPAAPGAARSSGAPLQEDTASRITCTSWRVALAL